MMPSRDGGGQGLAQLSPTAAQVSDLPGPARTSHPLATRRSPARLWPRVAWLVFCLALPVAGRLPAAESADVWTRYFPQQAAAPADEAGWAALAKEFPNRVKPAPGAAVASTQPPAATRTSVRDGIEYVRVRKIANDLGAIERALTVPRLIIDLRYVHGDVEPSLQFGTLLARHPIRFVHPEATITPKPVRSETQTTLCLINRGTSGAIEAVLDALQAAGDVLLVGTQSAGDTGDFTVAENAPGWRVITNDYRRAGGTSLLDVGVTPDLFVETTPDAEDAAYLAFDASKPIDELLDVPVDKPRFDEAHLQQRFAEIHPEHGASLAPRTGDDLETTPPSATETDDSAAAEAKAPDTKEKKAEATSSPFDRSLERAVATLVADQVLSAAQP